MRVLSKIKFHFFAVIAASFLFFLFPSAAKAATLYFSPSSGTYTQYDNFSVSVYVSSTDQAMNAAAANISFPTSKLTVSSISTSGSIINFWVESPTYSNTTGIINFAGTVFTPGYTGSAGKLITINFTAAAAGAANVIFNTGSVLANDGQGTEILTGMTNASFTINAYPPPSAPTVTSATHPSSAVCYESNDPTFNWNSYSGITAVHASIDTVSNTIPTTSIGIVLTKSYTDVTPNNKWYFHIRRQNIGGWSETTHFEFNLCTPDVPAAPTVTSPTHPVSAVCYESNDPTFNWTNPSNTTGVRASLDTVSNTVPTASIGIVSTKSYTDIANNKWYFHIRLANEGGWGATAHYEINVCTPDVPAAPTVTSPTHPVSDTWYENNDPVFNWTNPSGITGVRVLIDRISNSTPTTSAGVVETYTTADIDVSEWYFHVRLQNAGGWGATAHYKFRVNAPCPACETCPACPAAASCPSTGGGSIWSACPICPEAIICKSTEVECPKTICPLCKKSEIECPKVEYPVCKKSEIECPKVKAPICSACPKTEEKVKIIFVEKGEAGKAIDYYEIQIDEGALARWVSDGNIYDLPGLEPGKHKITITAKDKDGAIISAFTQEISVGEEKVVVKEIVKEEIKKIIDFPVLFLLIIIMALLCIIGGLIYFKPF
jgi:hypothetical protein